jgi:hypothetical protein
MCLEVCVRVCDPTRSFPPNDLDSQVRLRGRILVVPHLLNIAGYERRGNDLLTAYIRSALQSLSKWRVVNKRARSR